MSLICLCPSAYWALPLGLLGLRFGRGPQLCLDALTHGLEVDLVLAGHVLEVGILAPLRSRILGEAERDQQAHRGASIELRHDGANARAAILLSRQLQQVSDHVELGVAVERG